MTVQPSFFDADPDAAPEGSQLSNGEPLGQPQAPQQSISAVHPVTPGAVGVCVEERSDRGVTDTLISASRMKTPHPIWNEVPQPLFASWNRPRQLEYCARRDDHSAAHEALDDEQAAFYRARAATYRALMRAA